MDRGYVKLWRKLIDSPVFSDPELWRLATWCLLKSSHKKRVLTMTIGTIKQTVCLEPGQFVTGRKSGADELGWNQSTFRNRLERLSCEPFSFIKMQKDSHYTVVTICNWVSYQSSECDQRTNGGRTEDERRTNGGHKQEGKNVKNNTGRFTPPTVLEVQNYCQQRSNSVDAEQWHNFYESKGWMVGKNKMKDWKAAVRTWEKNDMNKHSRATGNQIAGPGGLIL